MKTSISIETLIVDDESAGRGILKKLLPETTSLPFSFNEASNVEDALEIVKQKKIDLVFLDVQMPVQNGFDFLKQIPAINFETIFVTGFDKYAVNAFRFNALDYLLKPVDFFELKEAVGKAIAKIEQKEKEEEKIKNLLLSVSNENLEQKIAVHLNDKVVFLELSQISHIKALKNYSEVVTINNQIFTTSHLLKDFEIYLESTPSFIRINRNCIVNSSCILSYTKSFPCFVELRCGTTFEISRRRKAEILKILDAVKI